MFWPHIAASQNSTSTGSALEEAAKTATGAIAERVFTKEERDLIRDVLGHGNAGDGDSDEGIETQKTKKNDKGQGKGKGKGKGQGKSGELPPGLAKRDGLPPGLAKRESLPPGLAKRSLPDDLETRLGPPPDGTERVIVDNDVLLIEKGTEILLDVITDVILGDRQ